MKKIILIIVLIITSILLVRNYTYVPIKLINHSNNYQNIPIDYNSSDINDIIKFSLNKTTTDLKFDFNSGNNIDFKNIDKIKKSHCVGYVTYFNTILKSVLEHNNISNYKLYNYRSEIHLLNFNIHSLFSNTKYKNHDISVLICCGKKYFIDPSLSELTINFIIVD